MAKRPPLSMPIAARTVAKPSAAEPAVSPAPPAGEPRDFKGVMARINRDGWKELSRLSIELDRPLQQMLVEAMNDYLQKHDRPPVIESRVPPKDE